MFKFLVIPLLCASLSAPITHSYREENHYLTPVKECVSYDNQDFRITLDDTEIVYTYKHLVDYLRDALLNDKNRDFFVSIPNVANYQASVDVTEGRILFTSTANTGRIYALIFDSQAYYDANGVQFDNYRWIDYSHDQYVTTGFSIYTEFETNYFSLKQAIELDIQANQTDVMPSASDLFQTIGQGITGFIGNLGSAIQSVTQLFWTTGENAGPTFLGLLMLLSIGAGLIFLGFRLIRGLVYKLRG